MIDVLDDLATDVSLPRLIEMLNAQKARLAGAAAAVPILVTEDYVVPPLAGSSRASVILAEASAGPVQITLPEALGMSREVIVVKADPTANAVTVIKAGSDAFGPWGFGGCPLGKQDDRIHVRDFLEGAWTTTVDLSRQVRTVSASGPILTTDDLVLVGVGGGSVTLTLPAPNPTPVMLGRAGGPTIKLINDGGGPNTLTVEPNAGGEIDNLGVDVGLTYSAVNEANTFRGDATQWWVV